MVNYLEHLFSLASRDKGTRRFLKYCLVGLSGVCVSFCVFWLMTRVAGVHDLVALILSTEASILSNFALNDNWTFRDRRGGSILTRIGKFHVVSLGVIALYYAIYTSFTRLLGIHDLVALLIAIGVGVAWNFATNVFWTWRESEAQRSFSLNISNVKPASPFEESVRASSICWKMAKPLQGGHTMSQKLRFAVVGCGRMGMRRIKAISNHPQTELLCLADNDEERAKELAQDSGVKHVTIEEAISEREVDCVVVSVPNKFHPSVAISALNQGKHVWCEKPLARNPREAMEIVKTVIKSRSFLKVASNLRHFPSVQKAKELLDNLEIGEVLFLRGWVGNSGWQLKSWFSDAEMVGGGTLLDNGCHLLDICRWFLGEAIECMGYTSTSHWQLERQEDNAMSLFKFKNGKLAFVHSSWTEWAEYSYIEIYGEQGYIRIDNRTPNCLTVIGRKDGHQEVFDFSSQSPRSHELEFNDFVQAIQNGQQPSPSGFDGLRTVQMAHSIYLSSRTGKSVKIWGKREENLLQSLATKLR
jgi:predicted dehydrogenase/putative flippase GtrA